MFKKFIRVLALMLVAIMLIATLASCKNSDVPDGYQLIACEGDKFRLYVPTQGWMPNVTGGITSAFFSRIENTSVSVYVADDAADMTLEEYSEYCNVKYGEELEKYTLLGTEKCVLGGVAAIKSVYSAECYYLNEQGIMEKKTYKFMQISAMFEGDIYLLVYSSPEEYYDSHIEEFEGNAKSQGIVPYFVFAEPYSSGEDKKYSDKVEAPAGMKLISTDSLAYRFFVPDSWQINKRADMSAAYFSESDKSNVSVQLYICGTGDEVQSVESYIERCKRSYSDIFTASELVSEENIKMSGLDAKRYIFAITSGGVEYKMMQAIVKKGDAIYCMTYTATAENYEIHTSDVEKMIEVFEIR